LFTEQTKTAPPLNYTFNGKEEDEASGLHYFGARYLEAETGRWLSIDPLAEAYPGHNPYAFGLHNPLRFIDPDGMEAYDLYTTRLGAAIDFARIYNKRSIKKNWEFGTNIYKTKLNGRTAYYYDRPRTDRESSSVDLPATLGFDKIVADIHTHSRMEEGADGYNEHSPDDRRGNRRQKRTGYVAVPNGELRIYVPKTRQEGTVATGLPHDKAFYGKGDPTQEVGKNWKLKTSAMVGGIGTPEHTAVQEWRNKRGFKPFKRAIGDRSRKRRKKNGNKAAVRKVWSLESRETYLPPDHIAAQLEHMYLIRTVREADAARIGPEGGKGRIRTRHPHTSVGLDGPVNHRLRHGGRNNFDHRHQFFSVLDAFAVNLVSSRERKQAGLLDLAGGAGHLLTDTGELAQLTAEGRAGADAIAHQLQAPLGGADQAHTVVDATRAKAALRHFETPTFAQDNVLERNTDVFQFDLSVAERGIISMKRIEWSDDANAKGICWHQNHTLLLVAGGIRIRFAHHNVHVTIWVHRTGTPPFPAVDNVLVSVANDHGTNVGCVGTRHFRFGHQEGGANLSIKQRQQPFFPLGGRTVLGQHFHISSIGRATIKDLRAPEVAAHFFGQRGVFQVRQAGAILTIFFWEKEVPEASSAGFFFQAGHGRMDLPKILAGPFRVFLV